MGLAETEAGPKTTATEIAAMTAAPRDMRMMIFCLDKDCFLGAGLLPALATFCPKPPH
jgi:hypothetical protein